MYTVPSPKISVKQALPPGIERRVHPRLGLNLLCQVSAPGVESPKSLAWTVNISRGGALVRLEGPGPWQALPPVGHPVQLDIELLTNRVLRCHGRVVRIQSSEREAPSIAVAIGRMAFCQSLRKPVVVADSAKRRAIKELLV